MAGNKYGARKMTAPDGQKFDSVKEYHRWGCLRLLERAGQIQDLKRQVKYELIPAQREESTEVYKAGPQKGLPKPGSILEKPCTYVADFTYIENGQLVVEDVKGMKTDAYKIKKKLMLWVHGIRIRET